MPLPSLVGQLICKPKATQAQTLARVVGSLGRSVLSGQRWDGQNTRLGFAAAAPKAEELAGWHLSHFRIAPKKQLISGFQIGTSSSYQSHLLECHIFLWLPPSRLSYQLPDVIQSSFSYIFCMPTWTPFFRPARLHFKLWDLPGDDQSINKIW